MQIKQMLFPMMSMALTMAPCSHLHAQGQTPVSQMEKLDRGLVALPAQNQGIFLSWRLLGTDSKHVLSPSEWVSINLMSVLLFIMIYPRAWKVIIRKRVCRDSAG